MLPEDPQGSLDNLKEGWESFLFRFKYQILIFFLGAIVVGLGVLFAKNEVNLGTSKIEVLEGPTGAQETNSEIIVEAAGEIEKPGVYKLQRGARIEDLLVAAGGLSPNADRSWVEKNLNRAAPLLDGQKIYILGIGEQSVSLSANFSTGSLGVGNTRGSGTTSLVNINSASQKDLEGLPGIGPVYAQNIVEQRPYSNIEELLTKGVLKQYIFDKIKDKVSVY